MLGQVGLDENQVVQSNLERRVAGARSAESLLDKHAKRKYPASRSILTAALGLRQLPDDLYHLSSGILKEGKISGVVFGPWIKWVLTDEAIDEVDLAIRLPDELGWRSLVDVRR